MNKFISLLNATIAMLAVILSLSICTSYAQADELKDISQMADQGQTAAAIDKLNAYINNNQKNAQALFMKGVMLAEQGRRDEAIKVFTDVTEKFPNLPEPYNNLAVLYADQGQLDKARKSLETAIKTHPSYATAHENLGDIYARMASEAYDKALQLDTSNTRAQGKLSLIKDLFGTGNKTTVAAKEPDKVAAADTKKSDNVSKKTSSEVANSAPASSKQAIGAEEELSAAVNSWAQAWSTKDLDRYFASYGASFKPAKGQSRKAWEEQRKERINKPSKIRVSLSKIKISVADSNNARVRFKQSYRADGKPIHATKTLIMKKEGDNWYIQQENASN
ncbi:Tetratricopeptide repeat [Methylophilaceae bacterium]